MPRRGKQHAAKGQGCVWFPFGGARNRRKQEEARRQLELRQQAQPQDEDQAHEAAAGKGDWLQEQGVVPFPGQARASADAASGGHAAAVDPAGAARTSSAGSAVFGFGLGLRASFASAQQGPPARQRAGGSSAAFGLVSRAVKQQLNGNFPSFCLLHHARAPHPWGCIVRVEKQTK